MRFIVAFGLLCVSTFATPVALADVSMSNTPKVVKKVPVPVFTDNVIIHDVMV
jgi:hypothetical protein